MLQPFHRTALRRAAVIANVLCLFGLSAPLVHAAPLDIDIPRQYLAESIKQLARIANVSIGVDGNLLSGKTAQAVKGKMEPLDALNRMLEGTGLTARRENGGLLTIGKKDEAVLEKITVFAKAPKEGTAELGYRPETVKTTGPWGDRPIKDTPYSINVVPGELIENQIMSSPDQLLRINPVVQLNLPTPLNVRPRFNMRGFSGLTSVLEDGMTNYNGWVSMLEDVERVEVLSGLSGFLYGTGNVGGVLNYVHKQPTQTPVRNVTIGDYGGGGYYGHADLGGPIDESGKLAYRLNLLLQDGDTSVDEQKLDRKMASGALDWRISDKLLLGVDASYQYYKVKGVPASWTFNGVKHDAVSVPAADKLWSQKWTYSELETVRLGTRMEWSPSDRVKARLAYNHATYDQDQRTAGNTVNAASLGADAYTQSFTHRAPRTLTTDTGYAFVDMAFDLGPVKNKLTAGYFGNAAKWRQHTDASYTGTLSGNFPLSNPRYVDLPSYTVGTGREYTATRASTSNFVLGDKIVFSNRFSALIGLTNTSIMQKGYTVTGEENPAMHYDKNETTPSASLIFKPVPALTTYVTYIEALEQGAIVPTGTTPPYTNAGEALEPMTSKQYEIGFKGNLGQSLLTASLFRIEKANQYFVTNPDQSRTYVQDGRQVNNGVEFTVSGKMTDRLTLVGGMTFIDAKVKKQANNPQIEGKRPSEVANRLIKLYGEYDIPGVPGLTLTGGIYHTGDFYADALNTDRLPSVTTFDLGARYQTTLGGQTAIFRLSAGNLANKDYWVGGNYVGDPRTIAFSAQIKF